MELIIEVWTIGTPLSSIRRILQFEIPRWTRDDIGPFTARFVDDWPPEFEPTLDERAVAHRGDPGAHLVVLCLEAIDLVDSEYTGTDNDVGCLFVVRREMIQRYITAVLKYSQEQDVPFPRLPWQDWGISYSRVIPIRYLNAQNMRWTVMGSRLLGIDTGSPVRGGFVLYDFGRWISHPSRAVRTTKSERRVDQTCIHEHHLVIEDMEFSSSLFVKEMTSSLSFRMTRGHADFLDQPTTDYTLSSAQHTGSRLYLFFQDWTKDPDGVRPNCRAHLMVY